MSAKFIVRRFPGEHYTVLFNPNNGFFARVEDDGFKDPFWSPHGPELMDISVTNWCDRGCTFCYRKSNRRGVHISLANYESIIRQASEMGVLQVALGGGNPNQHPDFEEILRLTRYEYGIIPNYTTNGRGLSGKILNSTRQYCGSVAVSAYEPYLETSEAVELLVGSGIRTNIHFILDSRSIERAISWLERPPSFLQAADAIVFLNYKPVGRYADEGLLLNRSPRIAEFFQLATTCRHKFRVGFDTCTVTGLARLGSATSVSVEGCDAGRFSMFVSEEMVAYPCSFMVETDNPGVPLAGTTLREIWERHPSFIEFRAKHAGGGCSSCRTKGQCLSGCPLFPQMNLCPENCEV